MVAGMEGVAITEHAAMLTGTAFPAFAGACNQQHNPDGRAVLAARAS
jgi:hypothetical protein